MADEEHSHTLHQISVPFEVLLCVDDSRPSWNAIHYYADHLHRNENKVLVLSVIELPEMTRSRAASVSPATLMSMWKVEERKAQLHLDKVIELLKSKWVLNVRARVERGLKPGETIVKIAHEEKVGLVVVGTRGGGALLRTVFGSVSDYIMHHANMPVTVVKWREHDHK